MTGVQDRKVILSLLWIFVLFNYIYADIFTLTFGPVLQPGVTVDITEGSALAFAVLMETAIAMVLVSRLLAYRANRWANICVGIIHTALVAWSLTVATPTLFYAFFATIEIVCTLFVVWYAWTWRPSHTEEEIEATGDVVRDRVTV
jgi:hypothetical protein